MSHFPKYSVHLLDSIHTDRTYTTTKVLKKCYLCSAFTQKVGTEEYSFNVKVSNFFKKYWQKVFLKTHK